MTDWSADVVVDDSAVTALIDKVTIRLGRDRISLFLDNVAAEYLKQRVDERFFNEGDETTGRWQRLRHTTELIRASQGYGASRPINRRTGALLKFVKTHRVGGASLTMPGSRGSAILNSKLSVAQLGGYPTAWEGKRTFGPSRPAPPRPVLAVGFRDGEHITGSLVRWIEDGARV